MDNRSDKRSAGRKTAEMTLSFLRRALNSVSAVSDAQLFGFVVAWVVVAGLLLQLVVLPYLIPELHWGHGLFAGMDWTSFHQLAVDQADRIRRQGWGAWELRPDGQFPAGFTSVLYYFIAPEPWVVLPVNGILFALVVTATRRYLAVIFGGRAAATLAVAPFFVYFSFVPIWGQLHKDVVSGAGLTLVLAAAVLAHRGGRDSLPLPVLVAAAAAGALLVWFSRPYSVFLLAGAAVMFFAVALFDRRGHQLRLLPVTMTVVMAAVLSAEPWNRNAAVVWDIPPTPPPSHLPGTAAPASVPAVAPAPAEEAIAPRRPKPETPEPSIFRLPRTRRLEVSPAKAVIARNYASCEPSPSSQFIDRILFFMCMTREGFKIEGSEAGSNYDFDLRMRSLEDYVAYAPRVLQFTLVEPSPARWGTEQSAIGRLASALVPFEMGIAYLSFGLALLFALRRLLRFDVGAVVVYCCTYTAFLVYTVPNMGTVYRMRAFTFVPIVCTALAAFLTAVGVVGPRRPEAMPDDLGHQRDSVAAI